MADQNKTALLQEAGESKQQLAYEQIKEDILNNTYPAGTVLAERKLCDIYHVSRSPIRNAIQQLTYEGLLTFIPGKGAAVTGFSTEDILEVYDLIEVLQIYAIRSLSANINQYLLESLKTALEQMEQCIQEGNLPKSTRWDQRFHQFLITSSTNKRLGAIYDQLNAQSLRFIATILEDQDLALRSLKEHHEIYDALFTHDLDSAELAIREHYKHIKQYYVNQLMSRI